MDRISARLASSIIVDRQREAAEARRAAAAALPIAPAAVGASDNPTRRSLHLFGRVLRLRCAAR